MSEEGGALETAFAKADEALARSIALQERKVLAVAHRVNPRLTADDVMQPHDVPELRDHWEFQYEDGILAGLRSAQMTLRASWKELMRPPGTELSSSGGPV